MPNITKTRIDENTMKIVTVPAMYQPDTVIQTLRKDEMVIVRNRMIASRDALLARAAEETESIADMDANIAEFDSMPITG